MVSSDVYKYDVGEVGFFFDTKLLRLINEENIPCPVASSNHEWSTNFRR